MLFFPLRPDKAAYLVEHTPYIAFVVAPLPFVQDPHEGQAAHLLHMIVEPQVKFMYVLWLAVQTESPKGLC